MRIGIEGLRIFRNHKHGIDITAIEYIRKLQSLDRDNQYFIFCFSGPDHFMLEESENFKIIRLPRIPSPLAEQFVLPLLARWYNLDLLHSTGNTSPLFLHCKRLITLHDIIYLEKKISGAGGSLYQKIGRIYRKLIVPTAVNKADAIVTVSKKERDTIVDFLPHLASKLSYIHNAASSHFIIKEPEHTLSSALKYKLPGTPYILLHGNTDPKKNLLNTLKAFALFIHEIKVDIKLVVTDISRNEIERLLKKHQLEAIKPYLHLTNYVNNHDMPDLYNRALFFLYPSLRESFGLPILEAMACGTPVITSEKSAMEEVAGNAAVLVNPHLPESISAAMLRLFKNEIMRKEMAEKGKKRIEAFNWMRSAKQLLDIYSLTVPHAFTSRAHESKKGDQPAFTS